MLIILKIGTILGLMWQNHPIYSSYTKIMESISGTYKILPSSPHTLTKKPIPNSNFFLTNTINLVKKNRQPRQKKKSALKIGSIFLKIILFLESNFLKYII